VSVILYASISQKPPNTPLLRGNGCVVSYTTAGAKTRRVLCARDVGEKFVRSFHQGRRLAVGSLSTCLQLPPALRPRHGPVRNSPLALRLVLYIYRA